MPSSFKLFAGITLKFYYMVSSFSSFDYIVDVLIIAVV